MIFANNIIQESGPDHPFADKDIEYIMGNTLRYGVMVFAAIVITGRDYLFVSAWSRKPAL